MTQRVDHPLHYGGATSQFEHVKVAEALGWVENAFIYSATKYLWRLGKKSDAPVLEDLKKARWYIDREIRRLETGLLDEVIDAAEQMKMDRLAASR